MYIYICIYIYIYIYICIPYFWRSSFRKIYENQQPNPQTRYFIKPSMGHRQGAWPKMFSQRLSNGCQVAAASPLHAGQKTSLEKLGELEYLKIRGKYGEIADVFSKNGDWTHLQCDLKHQNWGQKKIGTSPSKPSGFNPEKLTCYQQDWSFYPTTNQQIKMGCSPEFAQKQQKNDIESQRKMGVTLW